MLALMQDRPLLISSLIEHAATFHPESEIVSRRPEETVRRTLSNPTWSCRRNLVRETIDIAQRCTHDTRF
jgi:fatty-acyl-CoA synthase